MNSEIKDLIVGTVVDHLRPLEESKNVYQYPYSPETKVERVWKYSPAHTGPYRGAIDFKVALGTQVLAPADGRIVNVEDSHDRSGPDESYADDLNYITISHDNGEFSQVAHLAKDSATVTAGDSVTAGQAIAVTGASGYMTEPHLHFFVFKVLPNKHFKGLGIRFN